jgi:serine phosphatase RsbU (regulator of sigma subunit)/pSer/pThr/pTyr-binding forkhead associated (FHA) protein
MSSEILIRERDGNTRRVPLEGEKLSIGRSHENDLCFPGDASLSRAHLIFESDAEGWLVRDLGSKNGTMVNGLRISASQRLRAGDRVAAGHLVVVFDAKEADKVDSVEFFAGGTEADTPTAGTVMTSLRGVLSGDSPISGAGSQGAEAQRRLMSHPAVAALMRAGRELAGNLPLSDLFRLILNLAIDAVGAERGVLMTLEEDRLVPRAVHGEGFKISTTVRDRVLREKTSVLVRNILEDEIFKGKQSISEQHIRTMMAVPLQTEDKVIGLLYVDSRFFNREFSPQDLELLTVLANHAAIRIENELLAEIERMEELLARDLEQAGEIQQSFLPLKVPVVSGIDLAGHNAACRSVGGDYYDFFTYPDGRVGVVLGDVAGKGMPAALLMSDLRARVQVLAGEPDDLSALMANLDRMVSVQCPANRFISLFFSVLDPTTGEMAYCNAGHNPPLVIRADGAVERLEGGGTVLGMLPEVGYEARKCQLAPGDLCAVFSDGVTEAVDQKDEEFGEQRLIDLLVSLRAASDGTTAAAVVESVVRAVSEWTAGTPQADDITVAVAHRIE